MLSLGLAFVDNNAKYRERGSICIYVPHNRSPGRDLHLSITAYHARDRVEWLKSIADVALLNPEVAMYR